MEMCESIDKSTINQVQFTAGSKQNSVSPYYTEQSVKLCEYVKTLCHKHLKQFKLL